MAYMSEIQTEDGPVIWVEETGDHKLRICVAHAEGREHGLLLTPVEAGLLVEQIELKKIELGGL